MTKTRLSKATLGVKIAIFRDKLDWDQEELAGEAGISVSSLDNIEMGKSFPSIPSMVSIADALGASVDELIGLEPTDMEACVKELKAFKKRNEVFEELPEKVTKRMRALAAEILKQ